MPESTQHPDGGVPLVRDEREQGAGIDRPHHSWSETAVLYDGAEPTHIAFPVAQAARLIDVDDPQVRERAIEAVKPWMTRGEKVDAIIAALQKGAPE